MQCKINLETEPVTLTVLSAAAHEYAALDKAGQHAIIDIPLEMPDHPDTGLLNWLDENPIENLQAVEWLLNNDKARTIREAVRYSLTREDSSK